MTEDQPMDRPRFEALAQAYEGDLGRWPVETRVGALSLVNEQPELASLLAEAAALDAMLGASPEAALTGVLREKLIASAPRARVWSPPQKWLSGAGLAAACVAGVLMGVSLSDQVFTDPGAEALTQASTSLGGGADVLQLEDIG